MNSVNLCAGSYDVTPIKFGLKFTLTSNSSPDVYNITITIGDKTYNYSGNTSKPFEFKPLKPCTEYNHRVSFMKNDSLIHCTLKTTSAISTMGISECKKKIKSYFVAMCSIITGVFVEIWKHFVQNVSISDESDINITSASGKVCLQSDWNISSLVTVKSYSLTDSHPEYCVKPDYNDTCTTLFFNITPGNCGSPFQLNKSITASGM